MYMYNIQKHTFLLWNFHIHTHTKSFGVLVAVSRSPF
eukprot:UN03429